jgi:hypothetical protein
MVYLTMSYILTAFSEKRARIEVLLLKEITCLLTVALSRMEGTRNYKVMFKPFVSP